MNRALHASVRQGLQATYLLAALTPQAQAMAVDVVSSQPVEQQVMPALRKIQDTLGEILSAETETGTAVVQFGEKITTAITETARMQREADNFNRQADPGWRKPVRPIPWPDSICSESASGTAVQVSRATRAAASRLTSGGGVSSPAVRDTLASLPVSPRQGAIAVPPYTRPTVRLKRLGRTVERGCVQVCHRCRVVIPRYAPCWMARDRLARVAKPDVYTPADGRGDGVLQSHGAP